VKLISNSNLIYITHVTTVLSATRFFCNGVTVIRSVHNVHCVSKNVTTLSVNNFYELEPILISFGTPYAETTGF